ncbi:type II secretion system protein GspL [Pseudomonas sp. FP2196]|uniref:type II secretion system protein GspL n=1 Tax=Pseudomonas sp. FP2196 TaxID=2954086 RepID=UPI002734EBDF|nr:type II secretion system protein GspL [Pseudomonas sp. FP2196]WLH33062.1 type II secretion system protein GspL [Pseudomonas sp. FP2196]
MKQLISQPLVGRLAQLHARWQSQWRGSLAQRLWQAWLQELRSVLPARVQNGWLPRSRERLLSWPLADVLPGAEDERVVLLLPDTMVLAQPLDLPLSATRELRSVVGFELDKYTPFPREHMHFVTRVQSRGKSMAKVLLVAILLERLQTVLDQCEERGLHLHAIDCRSADGEPLGVDLLPDEYKRQGATRSYLPRYLAVTCVGLLLACMLMWLDVRSARVEAMQDAVDQQREQVQALQNLRRELINTQGAARYLAQRKTAQPTVSSVLLDLTGCLGADTWVEQLDISEDGGVSISGQSAKASALIGRAKDCRTLSDAQFQGIIQPDEQTGKERFSLRAQLRKEHTDAS